MQRETANFLQNRREHLMQKRPFLPMEAPLTAAMQTAVGEVMQIGSKVQPFSAESVSKMPRIRDAQVVKSVCPYCAVGCGLNVYVEDGKVLDIEGNPDSPINHGTLCPKGSATFQYTINPSRLTRVLYRAPYSTAWETVSLDWAMEQIAQRVKKTRDETFVTHLEDGREVNHTLGIASLGGATLDVEENYLMKKLFTCGLGIVSIENQARI
jgi:formate dehydrogenase major subunit